MVTLRRTYGYIKEDLWLMAGGGPDQHCTMREDYVTIEHLAGYGQGRSHPAWSI